MHFSTLVSGFLFAAAAIAVPVQTSPLEASPLEARGGSKPTQPYCPVPKQTYLNEVKKQFATDRIVPDLIERINPKLQVNISYNGKAVNLGTYFTTPQTLLQPQYSISAEIDYKLKKHDPYNTTYSLFLVDPDVPQTGSPVQVNYLHWVVSHLQPSCVADQYSEQTVIYQSPSPASTTQHRYSELHQDVLNMFSGMTLIVV